MKEKYIKVVKISPRKRPEVITLKNTLEDLQDAVSIGAEYRGLIECVYLEDGVDLLLNEEGKLIGLEPNRHFGDDILCGTFYVVGFNIEEGNLCSLTEDKIKKWSEIFKTPQAFLVLGDMVLIENLEE